MFAKISLLFSILAILALPALAGSAYHDYSSSFHWSTGHEFPSDNLTSVRSCTIQGADYLATTGYMSGLTFFALQNGELMMEGQQLLAGTEVDAVVQDLFTYVVAQPDRLHKLLTADPSTPALMWTDVLPASPVAVAEFGDLLLISSGDDGLLIYDPTLQFNLPTGVIGTWLGNAQQAHVIDNLVLVRTEAGLVTLDLTDPANPVQVGSLTTDPCQDLTVVGNLAYLAVDDDVVEVDISDPTDPIILRTLFFPAQTSPLQTIMPYGDGILATASSDLHYWDLSSGEMTWSGFSFNDGQDLALLDGNLALACGIKGLQIFNNPLNTQLSPSSQVFDPNSTPYGNHVVDNMLILHGSNTIDCWDLNNDPPTILWDYETDENLSSFSCVSDGLLYTYSSNGQVGIMAFDESGISELNNFTVGLGIYGLGILDNGYLALYGWTADIPQQRELQIWDVNDPAFPQLCTQFPYPYNNRFYTTENTVALANLSSATQRVSIFDASDPYNLQQTTAFDLGFEEDAHPTITAADGYLFIVWEPVLQVVDISDPNNLQFGPEIYIPDGTEFHKHNEYGYLLGTDLLYDLEDPLFPKAIGAINNPALEGLFKLAAGSGFLVFGDYGNRVVMPEHGSASTPVPNELPPVTDLKLQAAPNPFNPRVDISFEMASAGRVVLDFHDVRGRRLDRREEQIDQAGPARVTWNGTDSSGRALPSGVYLVEVRTSAGRDWIKVVLAR